MGQLVGHFRILQDNIAVNEGPPGLTPTECIFFDMFARRQGTPLSLWAVRRWVGPDFDKSYIHTYLTRLRQKVNRPGTGWRLERVGSELPRTGMAARWYAVHRMVRVPPVDSQAAPL